MPANQKSDKLLLLVIFAFSINNCSSNVAHIGGKPKAEVVPPLQR
jgi:hypothetical protein